MRTHRLAVCLTAVLSNLRQLGAAATVTLSGEPISIGSGGYPRAVQLADNTLLAAYQSSNSTVASLKVRRSTDAGVTWSEEYIARSQKYPEGKRIDLNNGFLYQTPSGDVLCAYRRHVKNTDNTITELNIEVSKSTDGGKTWSFLSTINKDPPRDGVKGDWEPFLRHNDNGKLEVYWAHEASLPNQNTVKKVSDDEGKTWGPVLTMTGTGLDVRDGMANLVALDSANKNLVMVFETNEVGPFKVWTVTSSDGGESWGNRKIIFNPETPTKGRQAGGPGIVNMNGTLVVSFMTNQDADVGDGYPHSKPGTDMKVITSTDNGKTWSGPTTVLEDAAWGGIAIVDERALVLGAAYITGKAAAQFITIG